MADVAAPESSVFVPATSGSESRPGRRAELPLDRGPEFVHVEFESGYGWRAPGSGFRRADRDR